MDDPDDLDRVLDKIKNRWNNDLTRGDWIKERDEEPPQRDLPKRTDRSRKKNKRNRRRK